MDVDGDDRLLIREKISNMSFEELAKLKAELGGQVLNEAVFGVVKKTEIKKRLNKNRPIEISSKIRPQAIIHNVGKHSSAPVRRDPRFDHLCGDFYEERFKKDYSFIKDIKKREKMELKKQLQEESDKWKKGKINFLITRMENQEREEMRLRKIKEKKDEEYESRLQMLREGKKPYYRKKSEKRLLELAEQYKDLKKKGKVEKVIQKYRQKKKKRDRKKFSSNAE